MGQGAAGAAAGDARPNEIHLIQIEWKKRREIAASFLAELNMTTNHNRREFLKVSSGALALAALAPSALGAEVSTPKKRELKKGYMLNTFPQGKNLSMLEKFQMLKEAGFDGVEPNSHSDRNEILEAQDKTGLAVASISCGPHTRMFSHAAPSERKKGLDGLLHALRDAKAFCAKSILVVAVGVDEKTS
jgi:hexulose-6-phosphate isomerase